VRILGLEDFPPVEIPGTTAYRAPEMFAGQPGNEATDIFALGVTMFRAFTGEFPMATPTLQASCASTGRRISPFCARICLRGYSR
jgi:serine/threonine protein kinase